MQKILVSYRCRRGRGRRLLTRTHPPTRKRCILEHTTNSPSKLFRGFNVQYCSKYATSSCDDEDTSLEFHVDKRYRRTCHTLRPAPLALARSSASSASLDDAQIHTVKEPAAPHGIENSGGQTLRSSLKYEIGEVHKGIVKILHGPRTLCGY